MTTNTGNRVSARERLLAAAGELFYAEGVHTVGIDRVIEHAGVAKATLYNAFGSKEELIRAYLTDRHEATRERMSQGLERYPTARERLIGVFEVQAELFDQPTFRGCAFISASAEARPGSSIEEVTGVYRAWVRSLFTGLAQEAGVPDPDALAAQLVLLYDGAGIGARIDRNPSVADASRTAAAALVEVALAGQSAAGRVSGG